MVVHLAAETADNREEEQSGRVGSRPQLPVSLLSKITYSFAFITVYYYRKIQWRMKSHQNSRLVLYLLLYCPFWILISDSVAY